MANAVKLESNSINDIDSVDYLVDWQRVLLEFVMDLSPSFRGARS